MTQHQPTTAYYYTIAVGFAAIGYVGCMMPAVFWPVAVLLGCALRILVGSRAIIIASAEGIFIGGLLFWTVFPTGMPDNELFALLLIVSTPLLLILGASFAGTRMPYRLFLTNDGGGGSRMPPALPPESGSN
jgi:hypothetical protein